MPARKSVQQEDIIKMNELYLEYHTYAEVARRTGFSPTTVKKYINSNFVPEDKLEIKLFNGIIPFASDIKIPKTKEGTFDWDKFLSLSTEEQEECEELRKEILL